MAEGFEAYHVPQQSRRDKLRVVVTQNQHGLVEPSTLLPLYDPSSFISSELLTSFHNSQKHNLGCGVKEERANLMMGFGGGGGGGGGVMNNGSSSSSCCSSNSSSVSYLDPESSLPLNQATIQVINNNSNNNMFLYQAQNLGEFDQGYNNNGGEIMVFKPEPLSLSLSSHNNGVNLQRYGSVVYGDKVGGLGGGGGGCVVYGGSGLNEASRCTVPMGPFTGYASILKGSRFLKPAQQLLEELCDVGGVCAEKMVADASLMEPVPLPPPESSSEDLLGDHGGDQGRKKSRLLTMLDEVCVVCVNILFLSLSLCVIVT